MRLVVLVALVALVSLTSYAQQDPQFTQWMYDRLSFNPAAAGMRDNCGEHCVSSFYRSQWDGFDRDPKTLLLNYSGQYGKNLGLGLSYIGDRLGQEQNSIIRLHGAYHHQIGNNFISGGLSLGFLGKRLGTNWVYNDENDPLINPLEASQQNDGTVDLSLGGMFYQPGKFYIGLSATHLNGGELADLNIKTAQHFYLMGGYTHNLNSTMALRGNVLAKSDLNAAAFDVNANLLYNNMLYGGISFRPGDAIAPMVGMEYDLGCQKKKNSEYCHCIRAGYSYDITLSDIADYSSGSHEIFVTYCFTMRTIKVIPIHGNPRNL